MGLAGQMKKKCLILKPAKRVNHDDGWYDAWNDVGHGACLVAGRRCLDPGSSSTDQISALLKPEEVQNEEVRNSCAGDNCIPLAGIRATWRCRARSTGLQGLHTMPLARTRSKHDRAKSRQSLGPEGWLSAELRTLLRGTQSVGNYLGRSIVGWLADRPGPHGAGQ